MEFSSEYRLETGSGTGRMDLDLEDISAVLKGDTDKYRGIIDRYTVRISRLILSQGIPAEEAEDLVQEVFIRAYTSLSRFNTARKFDVWLMGIAVKTVQNFWRQFYRRSSMIVPSERYKEEKRESTESILPDPLDELLDNAAKAEILESLDILSGDQRMAVTLYYFEDMTVKEIHRVTKWGDSKIKILLHRAREKLKNHLDDYFSGEDI